MKKINIFSSLIVAGIFFLLFTPSIAKGVENVSLTISPPINELRLEPGSKSTYGLSLYNNSSQPIIVNLRASEFFPEGDDGQVNISDESLPQTKDWITISPARVKLLPKKSKTISYTIALPKNASPGGFYFAIVASSTNHKYSGAEKKAVESGASVIASVSELVLVRINGPVNYNARISQFSTHNQKRFFNYGPVDLNIKIKNLSNVHSVFSNTVVVNNLIFPEKYVLHLKSQRILPQAVRLFKTQVPNKWHFGYYKAALTTTYAGGNNLQSVIMFWIVPVREIAIGLAVTALIILLIIILIKKSRQKEEEIKNIQKTVESLEKIEQELNR